MARRAPEFGWRYLLNVDPQHLEVHDLDNEQLGLNQCQINEIIRANHAKYLTAANNEAQLVAWFRIHPEYDGCRYCLPQYHRK
jgi:hypothetical protein